VGDISGDGAGGVKRGRLGVDDGCGVNGGGSIFVNPVLRKKGGLGPSFDRGEEDTVCGEEAGTDGSGDCRAGRR
jgi:hypothetical protein